MEPTAMSEMKYNMEDMTFEEFKKIVEELSKKSPYRPPRPMTESMHRAIQKAAKEYFNGEEEEHTE